MRKDLCLLALALGVVSFVVLDVSTNKLEVLLEFVLSQHFLKE